MNMDMKALCAMARKRGIEVVEHASQEPEREGPAVGLLIDYEDRAQLRVRATDPATFRRRLADATLVVADLGEQGCDVAQSTRFLEIAAAMDHLIDDVRTWMCADHHARDLFYIQMSWDRLELVRSIWVDVIEEVDGEWGSRHLDPFQPARAALRRLAADALWAMVQVNKAEAQAVGS